MSDTRMHDQGKEFPALAEEKLPEIEGLRPNFFENALAECNKKGDYMEIHLPPKHFRIHNNGEEIYLCELTDSNDGTYRPGKTLYSKQF